MIRSSASPRGLSVESGLTPSRTSSRCTCGDFSAGSRRRSQANTKSDALTVPFSSKPSPNFFCHFASRSLNVHVLPSGDVVHDVAAPGFTSPVTGSITVRPSKQARTIRSSSGPRASAGSIVRHALANTIHFALPGGVGRGGDRGRRHAGQRGRSRRARSARRREVRIIVVVSSAGPRGPRSCQDLPGSYRAPGGRRRASAAATAGGTRSVRSPPSAATSRTSVDET